MQVNLGPRPDKKERNAEKAAKAERLAAARAQKQQERDAANAQKSLQLS
jgi:hypothetical protein